MRREERIAEYKARDTEDLVEVRYNEAVDQRRENRTQLYSSRRGKEAAVPSLFSSFDGDDDINTDNCAEKMRDVVEGMRSDDIAKVTAAVSRCRKLLSIEKEPPIAEAVEAGAIDILTILLTRDGTPVIQFEAAWALTNIASGSSQHTQAVVGGGAVPLFVELLRAPQDDVKEQAVWALGNIAGDCIALRDMVLGENALSPLLGLLGSEGSSTTMLRNCAWTVSNLCRGKPAPALDQVAPAIPVLTRALFSPDEEIMTDCAWAMSYLADSDIAGVIESGCVRRLVELLSHVNYAVVTPALRTLGSLVTGDDVQTQVVLNAGVLQSCQKLLGSPKSTIVKETCWMLSNVTAGNRDQIQMVCDVGVIPTLIELIGTADFKVRKEAVWAVSNLTSGGTKDQVAYVVQSGALQGLTSILHCHDPRTIEVALEGIENILGQGARAGVEGNEYANALEENGGLDKIEMLQQHEKESIYERAVNILQTYFDTEDS